MRYIFVASINGLSPLSVLDNLSLEYGSLPPPPVPSTRNNILGLWQSIFLYLESSCSAENLTENPCRDHPSLGHSHRRGIFVLATNTLIHSHSVISLYMNFSAYFFVHD